MTNTLESGSTIESSIDSELQPLQSPIRVLPTELLGEIFWFYIAPVRKASAKPRENAHAILLLSQVCRDWQQVAHGTPGFWTDLSVFVDHPGEVAKVQTWLERSAHLPLSLTLIDISDALDGEGPDFTVMNALLLEKSRLASLEILTPHRYSTLAPIFAERLDALHTLRFTESVQTGWGMEVLGISGEKVDLSAFAPNVRTLLFPPDFDWDRFFTNIPWTQLARLTFLKHHDAAFDILRQCVSLEHLHVHTNHWDGDDEDDILAAAVIHAPLVLPNLRHFGLTLESSAMDVGIIAPFFRPLTFPALTSLRIEFEPTTTFWGAEECAAFQARAPHITHIELHNVGMTSEEMIALLRASPALKSLRLTTCTDYMEDAFLRALTYRDSDAEPLAPQLEALLCRDWRYFEDTVDEAALEAMIRSRWRPGGQPGPAPGIARLASISIRWAPSRPLSAAFVARMRDCIEDGNDIS
ncbi:hypothetical protein FB451DRAFT_1497303 [Mycena latifolia]|nr:hypothetical protein FB451DRAFT_1497303 [Mycena latifolia]